MTHLAVVRLYARAPEGLTAKHVITRHASFVAIKRAMSVDQYLGQGGTGMKNL
jgi:hypothetical protein